MPEIVLHPYAVALTFADGGPMFVSAVIAPTSEAASAIFTTLVMQANTIPQPLSGCAVTPLNPDFLRAALRAVEGKLPPDGEAQVLSLVPQAAAPVEQITPETPQDDPPPAA